MTESRLVILVNIVQICPWSCTSEITWVLDSVQSNVDIKWDIRCWINTSVLHLWRVLITFVLKWLFTVIFQPTTICLLCWLWVLDFETSELEFEVLKSSIWKHATLCDESVFSSTINLATWTTNWVKIFTGLSCYMLRYSKWEDWSWQLPILSSVFKCCILIQAVCFSYCLKRVTNNLLPHINQSNVLTVSLFFPPQ